MREALSDCLDMLARFTHSASNDLNHVEARAVYRAGRAALAAIDTAPEPPGWPDPLESPQAEAIRNGKLDDTEIRNLFDCMERELRLHRERAVNPAQGVSGLLLKAAEMAERSAALNEVYQAREEYLRFAQDCRAAIGAGGQAVAGESYNFPRTMAEAREALEGINEWLGQRQSGEATTNSEAAIFQRVHSALQNIDAFALADLSNPPAQPGWRMAPEEPTDAMIEAADHVDWGNEDERATAINVWHSMLSAAPLPGGA